MTEGRSRITNLDEVSHTLKLYANHLLQLLRSCILEVAYEAILSVNVAFNSIHDLYAFFFSLSLLETTNLFFIHVDPHLGISHK